MDSEERATLAGALTTEHYVLQSAAGTAISEAGNRVTAGLQGLMYQQAIARIRRYYRNLDTDHAVYFGKYSRHEDPADITEALAMLATKKGPEVFSIATTAALITAAIAGIGTALLVVRIAGGDALPVAYPIGAVVFVVLLTAFFRYERARYREVAN